MTQQQTHTAQSHTPQPSAQQPHPTADPSDVATLGSALIRAISGVVVGKEEAVRLAVVCLLTEGHLLIEDVPGTGKTSLAKALAKSVAVDVSRVQFTPDLMPTDVTGASIYNRLTAEFEFRPGPIFANVVVADEINRASPKTQSALLEAMEERQVSVDGVTYALSRPFLVLATQNPVETEGTYPLPEAQRDRFLAQTALGYPDLHAELDMVAARNVTDPMDHVTPVANAGTIEQLVDAVTQVAVSDAVRAYVVSIVRGTRTMPGVRLGASPRAALHLVRAAKAAAALAGRAYVVPDDVAHLAVPVLAHRLLLAPGASGTRTREEIIDALVRSTPVPRGARA